MGNDTRETINESPSQCPDCSDKLREDSWGPFQPSTQERGGRQSDLMAGPGDVGTTALNTAFARMMKSAEREEKLGLGGNEVDSRLDYNQLAKSAASGTWSASDKKDLQDAFTRMMAKGDKEGEKGLDNMVAKINDGLKDRNSPNWSGVVRAENDDGSKTYFMFATGPKIDAKQTINAIQNEKDIGQVFKLGHVPKRNK